MKVVYLEKIGEVHLKKHRRSRNINISLKPFAPVKVTMPHYASYQEALRFVEVKQEWIIKSRQKLQLVEKQKTVFTEDTYFTTRKRILHIKGGDVRETRIILTDNRIRITYPKTCEITSPEIQEHIQYGITEALRTEAKEYLPARVAELADKYCFAYKKVFIKNNKSSWGSCSSHNNINLNLHLMRLDQQLIDYVIAHELAHTVEKNHSHKFWELVDKVTNYQARFLDKRLQKYQIEIF